MSNDPQDARFPQFSSLPKEVRLQIWQYALDVPGQVFELGWMCTEHHTVFPSGARVLHTPAPRVLSMLWVNFEARTVAKEYLKKNFVTEADADEDGEFCPPWPAISETKILFHRHADIAHINWYWPATGYWGPDPDGGEEYNAWPTFRWLVKQAAGVSLSAEVTFPFFKYSTTPTTWDELSGYARALSEWGSHRYVVLVTILLHIPHDDIGRLQVFGSHGERPLQLVNARETDTLSKFKDAWLSCPSSATETEVARFFDDAIDAADQFAADLDEYQHQLEMLWVYEACEGFVPPDYLLGEPDAQNMFAQQVDKEHEGLEFVLEDMPVFEPVIMFRLCSS